MSPRLQQIILSLCARWGEERVTAMLYKLEEWAKGANGNERFELRLTTVRGRLAKSLWTRSGNTT